MNRTFFKSIIILLFCLLTKGSHISAQNDTVPQFVPRIEWNGYVGTLVIHREAMEDMKVTKPYLGQELRLGIQTTGKKYWEQLFKYPIYGVGFYSGYFNNDIIGNPFAAFAFFEIPFVRKPKHYWSTSWASGIGFNVNEYNETANNENVAIGTDANIYVDFSTVYKYKISPKLELGGGMKFQHLSNGALRHPNLGLNMLSAQVSIAYLPSNTPIKFFKQEPEPIRKKFEYTAMYAGGVSSVSQENNTIYYNSVVSVAAHKVLNFRRTLGFGVDVFYNEYLKEMDEIGMEAPTSDLMSYAGFVSTELVANKLRFVVQAGVYVWRKVPYDISFYERLAVRYYFIPNVFANVSIKAHGFKAQYIEYGIGCAF